MSKCASYKLWTLF